MLAAAQRVFAERGIDAASVDEVAAAAGLTKGAVYSSFRSKNELVLALMEEYVADRLQESVDALDARHDAGEGLLAVGARLVAAMRTDPTWQRLLIAYAVRADRDPELRAALRDRRRRLRAALASAIDRVARHHALELPFGPDEAAMVVLALSNGFAVEDALDPGAVPPDLFGRVLAALATRPDPPG
ncbi:TetR/AcrR family transcriptional regulator [Prauserella muralis]|uniref:TetR/AcrR family transcriptional regulator n=1 Tax=Prauserella muralis TaxID=588067 RepID=UPI001FEB2175|nr:TetR/AcrR family transcriptional regulator [Prauserella muralis]